MRWCRDISCCRPQPARMSCRTVSSALISGTRVTRWRRHKNSQLACAAALPLQSDHIIGRSNARGTTKISLGSAMTPVSRRLFITSSAAAASWIAAAPAIIGRAEAATLKLKCSSSLPNDPKFANGRVYYDNLIKSLKANGLSESIGVSFFPDNQLGQELDVIYSVKLGVIDLMVSGS